MEVRHRCRAPPVTATLAPPIISTQGSSKRLKSFGSHSLCNRSNSTLGSLGSSRGILGMIDKIQNIASVKLHHCRCVHYPPGVGPPSCICRPPLLLRASLRPHPAHPSSYFLVVG